MNPPDVARVVESLSLGVIILDPEGRVVHWNAWMAVSSGIDPGLALGGRLEELLPGTDGPALGRGLKSVFAFGNELYFSRRARCPLIPLPPAPGSPGGFVRMELRCVMGPVRGASGKVDHAFLLVEDVTEAAAAERRLEDLAFKDTLTGAFNRRAFDERLVAELERAKRYGGGIALVMLDLDHFKDVNDRLGHQFGDEVLRRVAAMWGGAVRAADLVARYGGEEFCAILPETSAEDARILADRLRARLSRAEVEWAGNAARVTASAGVAVSRPGDGPDELLRRADQALYRAKASGRDRTEVTP